MAWEQRDQQNYFYRSVREAGRVRKLYYGSGEVGRLAAAADALRRAQLQAAYEALRAEENQLDVALVLTRKLSRRCALLAAATLLAAGYHRPGRHHWRKWRDGRKALRHFA